MRRNLALTFFLCLAAITGFAQGRLDGKWATDRPDPLKTPDGSRQERVQLELTVADAKASGTITIGGYGGGLGGTFHTFKDAKVTGNKALFRVEPQRATDRSWAIEMVDDNTVMLYRGDLPIVGTNVLDLISALGQTAQPTPAVQVAPSTVSALPPPWIGANPTAATCGQKDGPNGWVWCVLLHRAK